MFLRAQAATTPSFCDYARDMASKAVLLERVPDKLPFPGPKPTVPRAQAPAPTGLCWRFAAVVHPVTIIFTSAGGAAASQLAQVYSVQYIEQID